MPVFQILDVAGNAVLDVGVIPCFATETAHLGEAGDAGFDECADVIVLHEPRKLIVVLNQVRARANDAHVAAQNIPKLWYFINAEFAKPFAEWIHPFVLILRLTCELMVIGPHRAKFVDEELSILHAGTGLCMKERAGRLEALRAPDKYRQDGKYEKHYRQRDGEIDRPFKETVQGILQRFFAETDKAKAVIFEVRDRMSQLFLQIADNEQPDAELIAHANNVLIGLGEGKLKQDYLGDAALANDLHELVRRTEHGNSLFGLVNLFIRNQTDCAEPDLGFAPEPIAELSCFLRGTDQQCFLVVLEDAARQDRWQIVMRKEQRDVEPRNKVKEKDSRNERVLRRNQIQDERAGTGNGLAQAQAVLPEQFVLEKIIFRAVTGKRLQKHPEHQHAAVDAVTAPGQFRAGRVKRDHHPDTEPEKKSDNNDLAEQEKAVETFRALRNHGYGAVIGWRVRDGGVASTRGKLVNPMIVRSATRHSPERFPYQQERIVGSADRARVSLLATISPA